MRLRYHLLLKKCIVFAFFTAFSVKCTEIHAILSPKFGKNLSYFWGWSCLLYIFRFRRTGIVKVHRLFAVIIKDAQRINQPCILLVKTIMQKNIFRLFETRQKPRCLHWKETFLRFSIFLPVQFTRFVTQIKISGKYDTVLFW